MKRIFSVACLFIMLLLCLVLSSCFLLRRDDDSTNKDHYNPNGFTVTFDSDGGSFVSSQIVKRGNYATEPEDPTRFGYIFLGWYYNDELWSFSENAIRGNITLIAKWEQDFENPAIRIDFNAMGGVIKDGYQYKDVLPGDFIGDLPTPTREGYKFEGWYYDDDFYYVNRITSRTRIQTEYTDSITIVAKWETGSYCIDGTENHSWSIWKDCEKATCTSPEKLCRTCNRCGHSEEKTGNVALGHLWSRWSHSFMESTRHCSACDTTETIEYKNITQSALGPANPPLIEGAYYESVSPSILVDKNFDNDHSSTITTKGGAISFTLDFIKAVYVDYIYVKGEGTCSYDVFYLTESGNYILAGSADLGSLEMFECGEKIISVSIVAMDSYFDSWQEIAIISKDE